MKTRSPFLALVKWEFSVFFLSGSSLLGWATQFVFLGAGVAPALMLWLQPGRWPSQIFLWLWADLVVVSWLATLSMEYSTALLREVGLIGWMSPAKSNLPFDEFLASRAIDRSLHFRAKSTMLALVLVLPLLLNSILIALVTGKLTLDITGFLSLSSEELFEQATGDAVAALAYAVLWASAAAIVSAQAYYGLASKLFSGRGISRVVLMAGFPAFLAMLAGRFMLMPDDLARAVQAFAAHWLMFTLALLALALPVQRFCERRFAEQEVL